MRMGFMKYVFIPVVLAATAVTSICGSQEIGENDPALSKNLGLAKMGLLATATEKNEKWKHKLSVSASYEDWRNDLDTAQHGERFTETVSYKISKKQWFKKLDTLSFKIEGGAAHANTKTMGARRKLDVALDTTIVAGYTTFRKKKDKKEFTKSGWGGELSFNLPTGKTKLSSVERAAEPNGDIVDQSLRGKGYGADLEFKYSWYRSEAAQDMRLYYVGAKGGWKGPYDPTSDVPDDRIRSGFKVGLMTGVQNLILMDGVALNLDLKYSRNQKHKTNNSNNASFDAEMILGNDNKKMEIGYALKYNDKKSTDAAAEIRDEDFQKGFTNVLDFKFIRKGKYLASKEKKDDAWEATFFAKATKKDIRKPDDSTFFATNWGLSGGVKAGWRAFGNGTPQFTGKVSYLQIGADGSDDETVQFSGYAIRVGLVAKF